MSTPTTAVYWGLVALLVLTLVRDIWRRPPGQGVLVTLKKPSAVSWVVMVLAVATIVWLA
ncbi:hypothetical protein [Cellulomonas sp.]|uniref:hypothetical protein n=1 Tax=Cellulomonas sp. TaxID=40001 RepID=UPI003BA8CD80